MHRTLGFLALLACCGFPSWATAGDPPDLEFNPVTGYVESVDVSGEAGQLVRHVTDQGQGRNRTVAFVSTNPGQRPRIAIQPSGDSWVAWAAGTVPNRLYYAKHTLATETWSTPVDLSPTGEDSHDPEILSHAGAVWMAYEIRAGASRSVVVNGVIDTPEPMPGATPIGSTFYGGNLDLELHAEAEHLWVTWIQSAEDLAWSERDPQSGQWSAPQLVPYALVGPDVALETVRAIVTQP